MTQYTTPQELTIETLTTVADNLPMSFVDHSGKYPMFVLGIGDEFSIEIVDLAEMMDYLDDEDEVSEQDIRKAIYTEIENVLDGIKTDAYELIVKRH